MTTPPSPGWCVVTEWDDGTVAVTAIVSFATNSLMTQPTIDELQQAAWLVACEVEGEYTEDGVLDVDKTRIHNCCGAYGDPDAIEFRVGDNDVDEYDTVYVRQMGRVTIH
jgi:hypothetical protein